jgi:hypothetical protein
MIVRDVAIRNFGTSSSSIEEPDIKVYVLDPGILISVKARFATEMGHGRESAPELHSGAALRRPTAAQDVYRLATMVAEILTALPMNFLDDDGVLDKVFTDRRAEIAGGGATSADARTAFPMPTIFKGLDGDVISALRDTVNKGRAMKAAERPGAAALAAALFAVADAHPNTMLDKVTLTVEDVNEAAVALFKERTASATTP